MLYLVSATLQDRQLVAGPREEFHERVQKVVLPSLELLSQFEADGKLLAGGVRAGTQDLVIILDLKADTHMVVRHLLNQLPLFAFYHWEVTPLESFKDWTAMLK